MSKALFNYHVRVSPRGRNVRLRVSLQRGLEVIVPKNYDATAVPDLLARKKHWIRTALERAESTRNFFAPEPTWRLPHQIVLPAVGMTWHMENRETEVPWVAVREIDDQRLLIFGKTEDRAACCAALQRWLMRESRKYLIPRLQALSLKTGLLYSRAIIKRQRTRWAGCSKQKTISLNVKLLFLPSSVVDYVLLHELCHVAEMNHSKRFWELVEKYSANFRKHDAQLREMWKSVPRWAMFP